MTSLRRVLMPKTCNKNLWEESGWYLQLLSPAKWPWSDWSSSHPSLSVSSFWLPDLENAPEPKMSRSKFLLGAWNSNEFQEFLWVQRLTWVDHAMLVAYVDHTL